MDNFHRRLDGLPRITLDQLNLVWSANSRHDAKFVMTSQDLAQLLDMLGDDVNVLEIDQRIRFTYHTEYFDTPERDFYRSHVQNKIRRYKIRERTYLDSGQRQLEIKAREGTSETHKHVLANSHGLDESGIALIASYLNSAGLKTAPLDASSAPSSTMTSTLQSSATTEFSRITLFRPMYGEKVTIDLNLELIVGDQSITASPHIALVEVKSSTSQSFTVSQLRHIGIRQRKFSKYSSAIDLLVSDRPRVHTSRTLSKVFGAISP